MKVEQDSGYGMVSLGTVPEGAKESGSESGWGNRRDTVLGETPC